MSVVSVLCRFHMAGDHGALTCSHLQSYDPDRALTDYISRLEALQRRLGSVTSGNTYISLCLNYILSVYNIYYILAFTGDFYAARHQRM